MFQFIKKISSFFSKKKQDPYVDKPVDFLSALVKDFFKKGKIVYSSAKQSKTGKKKKVVLSMTFDIEIPPIICKGLENAEIILGLKEQEINFQVEKILKIGNVAYLELEAKQDIRVKRGDFFRPQKITIKTISGMTIPVL